MKDFLSLIASIPSRIAMLLIKVYRLGISPVLGPNCRFTPTCSAYALEAIKKYGPGKGLLLSIKRILKCNPFHEGGYDPVP